ncbi:MAG: SDR family NAD(P)-dependent oxidoreductase [Pseudobdellovibrionaceae bacterium]
MDLNLRERTTVILGPTGPTLQNLVVALTQQGSDVALIDADASKMQRFCNSITDQREVNPKFGRATAIPLDMSKPGALRDAIGTAAQTFGSIDIFIDALSASKPTPFQIGEENKELDSIIAQNLTLSLKATEYAAGFLKGRKRGRIIYLLQDAMNRGLIMDAAATAARTGLIAFAKTMARQLQEVNVTVNCVSLGLTEEYLLGHFPDCASIKEAQEKMKSVDPLFRISEPEKVANSLVYLCSASGAAVTGQHLVLS